MPGRKKLKTKPTSQGDQEEENLEMQLAQDIADALDESELPVKRKTRQASKTYVEEEDEEEAEENGSDFDNDDDDDDDGVEGNDENVDEDNEADEQEEEEKDTDMDADDEGKPKARKSKTTSRRSSKAKATKSSSGSGFFNLVKGSGASFKVAIDEWISEFKVDSRVINQLINLVLTVSGSESSLSLEDLEGHSVEILSQIQEKMIQASSAPTYLIQGKTKDAKKLKKNYMEFWKSLIREISSDIIYSTTILDDFLGWVVSLTSSKVRALRHTSTICCLSMLTGLCKVGRLLQDRLIKETKESVKTEISGRIDQLEDAITKIFDSVFVNRYLDVETGIRVDCLTELTSWIDFYPEMFLVNTVLRYYGYLISDKSHEVRLSGLKGITLLCRKTERVQSMVMFLERFKKRIMEVATLDMNDQVRLAGLNLVSVIIDHNIFDSDSISSLRGLIFDEHLKVRESVALIIKGVLEQGSIKNLVSIADSCGLPKTEIKKRAILKGLSSYVAESEGSWLNAKLFYDAMNAHFPILADFEYIFEQLIADESIGEETLQFTDNEELILLSFCESNLLDFKDDAKQKDEYYHSSRLIIDSLSNLIERFKLDDAKLQKSIQLLLSLDLGVFEDSKMRETFETVWETLGQLFMTSIDLGTLNLIAQSLCYFSSIEDLDNVSKIKFSDLKDEIILKFDALHGEDNVIEIYEENRALYVLRRMVSLSKQFDFIELQHQSKLIAAVQYLAADDETLEEGDTIPEEIGCLCLSVLYHDVVWKAINYRKALLQVTDLKAYRDDLLDECFKILEKGQTSMKIASFNIISELVTIFSKSNLENLSIEDANKEQFAISKYSLQEEIIKNSLDKVTFRLMEKPFVKDSSNSESQKTELEASQLVVSTIRLVTFSETSYGLLASIIPFYGIFENTVNELVKTGIQECLKHCGEESLLMEIVAMSLIKSFDNSVGLIHQAMAPFHLAKIIYQSMKGKVFVSDSMVKFFKDGIFHAIQHIVSFTGPKNVKERNHYIKFFKLLQTFVPMLNPRECSLLEKHLEVELKKYSIRIVDPKDWDSLTALQKALNKNSTMPVKAGKKTPSRQNTPMASPSKLVKSANVSAVQDDDEHVFDLNEKENENTLPIVSGAMKRSSTQLSQEEALLSNNDNDEEAEEAMSFQSSPLIEHLKSSSPEKASQRKRTRVK